MSPSRSGAIRWAGDACRIAAGPVELLIDGSARETGVLAGECPSREPRSNSNSSGFGARPNRDASRSGDRAKPGGAGGGGGRDGKGSSSARGRAALRFAWRRREESVNDALGCDRLALSDTPGAGGGST